MLVWHDHSYNSFLSQFILWALTFGSPISFDCAEFGSLACAFEASIAESCPALQFTENVLRIHKTDGAIEPAIQPISINERITRAADGRLGGCSFLPCQFRPSRFI